MADLTQKDVARAVQDGLRNIQSDITRLSSAVSKVDSQAQWIDDIQRAVQSNSQKMDRVTSNQTDLKRIVADVTDLRREIQGVASRIANIERFCQDTSRYLQELSHQKSTDDDGFRSSNANG